MPNYPVSLNLKGRRCMIIGARSFVLRKIEGLLDAEAEVTVVASEPCPEVGQMAQMGEITLLCRNYRHGDLAGFHLAINTDHQHAQIIAEDARTHHVLLNSVDRAASDFLAPCVLRQGDLEIAISTSGIFPALAVRLRQRLSAFLGPEYARFLELTCHLRDNLQQSIPDYPHRKQLWYALVDSDVLELLRRGDDIAAEQRIRALIENSLKERSADEPL